ncbi:hypothetical protein HYALB_00011536 [Hymenoscyphus albidus]|uniref:Uncharacterized protein n=1 Tax=Hymenoscyphus albidus TaxID=595503 RepID=A0A9N9Q9N9_9HELO|nr:hypothetical protein HYALB_00011536 [Hymenoscyphus albidus]
MPPTVKIQTEQPIYQSTFSSPSSSLPDFDIEKRYQPSEKQSPTESIRPLHRSSPLQSAISSDELHTKPWPERPQLLAKTVRQWRWWEFAVDSVMLMLPIPFFMLIAAILSIDQVPLTPKAANFFGLAIKGAATLFPIFFAACAGRAAIKYATWKLQEGAALGHLEQLMGSRTIWSTFNMHFQLRSFNTIGILLIIVWCFEPLGGQSVLHIYTTPSKSTTLDTNVTYFNSRQASYSSPKGVFKNQWFSGFTVLFASSLLSTVEVKTSSVDMWGNVKIPYYSKIEATGAAKNNDGWIHMPANFTPIYSSLFGLPISKLGIGNTTFNVESTYTELSCGNMSVTGQPAMGGKSDLISTTGPFVSFQNVTISAAFAVGYQGPDLTAPDESDSAWVLPQSCPDCLPEYFRGRTVEPGKLAFQEFAGFDNTTSIICTPLQQYIESTVSCIKSTTQENCRVTAQRPSILPHMPSSITPLSFPEVAMGLTELLPNSTPNFNAVNMIENFIYNPSNGAASNVISGETSFGQNEGQTPLLAITPDEFASRFGQLMNAYLYGSMWNSTPYLLGAPFEDIQARLIGTKNASFIPATPSEISAMILNQTVAFTVPAKITTETDIFFVFYSWLTVFLLANLIMMGASIASVYYARRTILPEYLGFVSSLAKESPYIGMPDVGINMDGMGKAKLLKDVKVRLGDVSIREGNGGGIGRLAFARLEDTVTAEKGKLYT